MNGRAYTGSSLMTSTAGPQALKNRRQLLRGLAVCNDWLPSGGTIPLTNAPIAPALSHIQLFLSPIAGVGSALTSDAAQHLPFSPGSRDVHKSSFSTKREKKKQKERERTTTVELEFYSEVRLPSVRFFSEAPRPRRPRILPRQSLRAALTPASR